MGVVICSNKEFELQPIKSDAREIQIINTAEDGSSKDLRKHPYK